MHFNIMLKDKHTSGVVFVKCVGKYLNFIRAIILVNYIDLLVRKLNYNND